MDSLLTAVRRLYAAIERFDQHVAVSLAVDRSSLRAINALGQGPLSPTALAHELGLTSGSITALLDRLESAGHISRIASAGDRRRRDVQLTPATYAQASQLYIQLAAALTAEFAAAPAATRQHALAVIDRLTAAFSSPSSSPFPASAAIPPAPVSPAKRKGRSGRKPETPA